MKNQMWSAAVVSVIALAVVTFVLTAGNTPDVVFEDSPTSHATTVIKSR